MFKINNQGLMVQLDFVNNMCDTISLLTYHRCHVVVQITLNGIVVVVPINLVVHKCNCLSSMTKSPPPPLHVAKV